MPAPTDQQSQLPPFRADHVGSLLRPPALIEARSRHAAGELTDEQLRAAEDDAITEVVAMQERIGLRAATDGEFRRTSWHMDFIYQLGGISKTAEKLRVAMRNAAGENAFSSAGMAVTGGLRLEHTIFG
jgi:5-methyltetrahydropteroyltriglutamate--homocysteine methyltransferase